MQRIRVLVVDDTTLWRQGLKSLLRERGSVEFVEEAANANEATELTARFAADVILLDTDMPGLDAPEAVRLIRQERPKVEIIALADMVDYDKALRILEAGATGYVLKDIGQDDLVSAIEAVCHGKTAMDPRVTRELVERLRMVAKANHGKEMGPNGLSDRELQVLLEMTKGATDREIAHKLSRSLTTVKSHVHAIFGKIGVKNRTQAVAYILQSGNIRKGKRRLVGGERARPGIIAERSVKR